MGFLHKLWDETLAGPAPDSGLSKLRKYNSFSFASSTSSSAPPSPSPSHSSSDGLHVTRAITILRSSSTTSAAPRRINLSSHYPASVPSSPASGLSAPNSPFSPSTPSGDVKKLSRKKTAAEPRSSTAYDWIVLSALDR